jgi:hypothetical protein
MPDDELMSLASQDKLKDAKVIEGQVDRMLADPKAKALSSGFAEQWLQIRKLAGIRPDPKKFAPFNATLRRAMTQQVDSFFQDVVNHDRSVLDFLNGEYTFLNGQLAAHYSIPHVSGPEFRRVQVAEPERRGLLGMAAILTLTSNPTRTSPTKRGRWILEQILGTPPPPPPPGADVLKPKEASSAALTLRQQMEEHRNNPDCASCHARMDPLGFSLENFDAIGRWRLQDEQSVPIDASGQLPDGAKFSGPAELQGILLSKKEMFVRSLAEKLMIYGLGRGVTLRDDCALDDVAKRCKNEGYKFSALIKGVVSSDAFRKRRIETQ